MGALGWLSITTLLLCLVAMSVHRGTALGRATLLTPITTVVRGWAQHAWAFFVGSQGYLVIFGVVTLYVGLCSLVEARHERRANRALFERSTFMSMVASGNRETFVVAMKTFGPVQTMTVPGDPELLAPWTWFTQECPN